MPRKHKVCSMSWVRTLGLPRATGEPNGTTPPQPYRTSPGSFVAENLSFHVFREMCDRLDSRLPFSSTLFLSPSKHPSLQIEQMRRAFPVPYVREMIFVSDTDPMSGEGRYQCCVRTDVFQRILNKRVYRVSGFPSQDDSYRRNRYSSDFLADLKVPYTHGDPLECIWFKILIRILLFCRYNGMVWYGIRCLVCSSNPCRIHHCTIARKKSEPPTAPLFARS